MKLNSKSLWIPFLLLFVLTLLGSYLVVFLRDSRCFAFFGTILLSICSGLFASLMVAMYIEKSNKKETQERKALSAKYIFADFRNAFRDLCQTLPTLYGSFQKVDTQLRTWEEWLTLLYTKTDCEDLRPIKKTIQFRLSKIHNSILKIEDNRALLLMEEIIQKRQLAHIRNFAMRCKILTQMFEDVDIFVWLPSYLGEAVASIDCLNEFKEKRYSDKERIDMV